MKDIKILLVEDEKQTAKLLFNILSKHYKNIICASDGKIGLSLFKKHNPAIVISDIIMPTLDGLDMAQEIKRLNKNTRIIILSAYSEKDKLLKAIDVSVDKYLIKPINPEQLLTTLQQFMLEIDTALRVNDYLLDLKTQELFYQNKKINLTKKEFMFLKLLFENNGQIVKTDTINTLWQKIPSQSSIRTFIKRLRDKLPLSIIKNIPSTGYKLEVLD